MVKVYKIGNKTFDFTNGFEVESAHVAPPMGVGVRAFVIRKNSPQGLVIRRIREYLLLSKLRSMLPPPSHASAVSEEAVEYELVRDEVPVGDSEEENAETSSRTPGRGEKGNNSHGEDGVFSEEEEQEEEEEEEEEEKPFEPSIKIKKLDETLLMISTIVPKDVALSSALFCILEEEKLDIVYENQYRTETKVAHTIQVRVGEQYDSDALKKKLYVWAGKQI